MFLATGISGVAAPAVASTLAGAKQLAQRRAMKQSFRGYSWQGADNKAKAPAAEVPRSQLCSTHSLHLLWARCRWPCRHEQLSGLLPVQPRISRHRLNACTGSMRAPAQCVQMPMMILTATPSVPAIGSRTTPKARPLVQPLGHVAGCSRSHRTNALDYCLLINHLQTLSLRGPHLCTS